MYDLGYQRTLDAVRLALDRLQTEFIDILLIHSPRCESAWADCTQGDKDDNPEAPLWLDTWRAFEKLYAEGVVLAIGVSNFNAELLARAITVVSFLFLIFDADFVAAGFGGHCPASGAKLLYHVELGYGCGPPSKGERHVLPGILSP